MHVYQQNSMDDSVPQASSFMRKAMLVLNANFAVKILIREQILTHFGVSTMYAEISKNPARL